MEESPSNVVIHPPNSNSLDQFDIDAFMGKWNVTHSTLPLWKNKKDVTITYTPIEPKTEPRKFNDIVEYRGEKASSGSKRSRVEGVDTLNSDPGPDGSSPVARYKWRGKGLLMIASSRWQVIGFGPGWAVTFFEKTLFTPAGLDIYSRDDKGLPGELLQEIIQKTKNVSGDVGKLAEGLFEVQRSKT